MSELKLADKNPNLIVTTGFS